MHRRLAAVGVTAALLGGGLVAAPASAVPADAGWSQARTVEAAPAALISPAAAYEREVLRLVNVERARAGVRPLALDSCAQAYARRQALVIARAGALSHQDLSRVVSACRARGAGENVAYGRVTASEMMRMWMRSAGHRQNVLRPSFTHLGVGARQTASGRWYAAQVFLRRS